MKSPTPAHISSHQLPAPCRPGSLSRSVRKRIATEIQLPVLGRWPNTKPPKPRARRWHPDHCEQPGDQFVHVLALSHTRALLLSCNHYVATTSCHYILSLHCRTRTSPLGIANICQWPAFSMMSWASASLPAPKRARPVFARDKEAWRTSITTKQVNIE